MTNMYIAWAKIKKTLKFVWRHFFTLLVISRSVKVLLFGSLLWKNTFILLGVAITIDWVKQRMKFTTNAKGYHSHIDSCSTPHSTLNDQWWNPNVMGTPAYLMRNSNYN